MLHYVHKVLELGTQVSQMMGIWKEKPSKEDDMLIDRQVVINAKNIALWLPSTCRHVNQNTNIGYKGYNLENIFISKF